MNWRVRWDDIMFGSLENDRKLKRQNSSVSRVSFFPCLKIGVIF